MKSKIKLIVLVAIISIATAENTEAEECCPVGVPSAIITIEAEPVPDSNGNYFDLQLSDVPAGYDISKGPGLAGVPTVKSSLHLEHCMILMSIAVRIPQCLTTRMTMSNGIRSIM